MKSAGVIERGLYCCGISVRFSKIMLRKQNTEERHPCTHTSHCSALLEGWCACAAVFNK